MSLLPYHRRIQEGISEFGKLHAGTHVRYVSRGGENLVIAHGTKKLRPITFKPDRIFTLSDRKRVAFQVLESQAKKWREIEADILRAYLCPAISKLIFIVPTANDADNVSRLTSIVQDGLVHLGLEEGLDLFLVLRIPRTAKSKAAVLSYLNQPQVIRQIFGEA